MRRYILSIVVLVPVLAALSLAEQCVYLDRGDGSGSGSGSSYGWSSDDSSGGSSYLGVDIRDVTSERVSALKLKDEHGVEVTMVDQDAPAGKAGLKEHDVILSLNGTAVESEAQLRRMIHETPAGRVVTLGISRDGQPQTIQVQLGERHKDVVKTWNMPAIPPIKIPEIEIPSIMVVQSSSRSGLTLENLTPQLGEFFGVKTGKGALIRSVEKGSRAEKAGLRAGDVVTKVDDQAVMDASDLTHALRSKTSASVTLGVVRDKKLQTFTLTLPEKKDSSQLRKNDGGMDFDLDADLDVDMDVDVDLDNDIDIDIGDLQDLGNLKELAYLQPEGAAQLQLLRANVEQLTSDTERIIRPEIEKAKREARCAAEQARKEVASQQREMQRMQRDLRQQSQEVRRQTLEQQRQMREEQRKLQEEMRREVRSGGAEI